MRYIKTEKVNPISNDFTILYDDREKNPWTFLEDNWPMKRKRLKVGDYTIQGLEDKIAIEKKSGLQEILTDLSGKKRKPFERFLKRLSDWPVKSIIVEEPLSSNTLYSALTILRKKSKGRSKLTASTVYHWVAVISSKYNIPIIFTDKYILKHVVAETMKIAYQKAQTL